MNIYICDNCVEHALMCKKKVMQFAQKYNIQLKTRVFYQGSTMLFEIENSFANIDLIYLDIQMPETDGMQTAISLRKMGYIGDIVFYSISPDYAIAGYDVSALHYVVKNVTTDEKFEEIFHRAYRRKQRRKQDILVLSCAGENRCIPISEIFYFEVNLRILTVHYSKDSFEFYSTIMRMEEQLFEKGFVRTHKSFLINTQWIRSIDYKNVILNTGEILPVGRKYYAEALKQIRMYIHKGNNSSII